VVQKHADEDKNPDYPAELGGWPEVGRDFDEIRRRSVGGELRRLRRVRRLL
jgi:hypothetical protein